MFIDEGTWVEIAAGTWAGRVGVVRKIRINAHDGAAVVFVDVITPSGADFELSMFEPIQLKKRKLSARQVERMDLLHTSHLMDEEEERRAA